MEPSRAGEGLSQRHEDSHRISGLTVHFQYRPYDLGNSGSSTKLSTHRPDRRASLFDRLQGCGSLAGNPVATANRLNPFHLPLGGRCT